MSVLLLRLAGPVQSWGDSSRFTRRETRPEPTKSGVLGLLAAAEGRQRTDDLSDLAQLRFGVRVDQPGRLVRDFQTAVATDGRGSMPLSYRYYLADAVFLAGVEGDHGLLSTLESALRAPSYPLYLGRRSCPVEGELVRGLVEDDLEAALRSHAWLASRWHRRRQGKTVALPILVDAAADSPDGDTETIRDTPLSFSSERREYGWRDVVRLAPAEKKNDDGQERMDFMAALGGA